MKRDIAYKVVKFWHIIEFLTQESFPQNTKENSKKVNLIKKEQEGLKEDNKKISKFTLFHKVPSEFEVSEIIERDNEFYLQYPYCSSRFHLCIGKIKREALINKLYQCLNLSEDRPEEDHTEICLFALKLDKDGVYEENSFRISPMVWGIHKCYTANGKIGGYVTTKNYYSDIKELEEKISKTEPVEKVNIENLFKMVFDKYIKSISEDIEPQLEGNLIYTRYDSEKTFNREDDKTEDVSELVKGFYTDDLEMIKEFIANDESTRGSDLIDYIVGAYYESEMLDKSERINIREEKLHIENWLSADKAPYGKWPSKFNPALMQQIAINIGINESSDLKKIFSVNGPPGTGKTTLLKEVIASNIVERARFICRYDKADDAFIKFNFEDGNPKYKGGYDQFCNKYYAFKDEKLSDFSMLVASCNNAAVENITKELPDGKALLSGIKPDEKDKADVAKGLADITDLFDVSKNVNKESYKVFVLNEKGKKEAAFIEKNDVYFSWLAHKLMSQSDEKEDFFDITKWGLISAPMGKSSNIGKYCYSVLKEVIESFYCNNAMIEQRHERYIKAKEEFSNQFSIVEELKKELANINRLSAEHRIRDIDNKRLLLEKQNNINNLIVDKTNFFNKERLLRNYSSANLDEETLHKLNLQIESIQQEIIKKEDSRKWYEVLFSKWMQTERIRQITECKKDLHAIEAAISTIQSIRKENKEIETIKTKIQDDAKKLQDILNEYNENMCVIDDNFWNDFASDNEEFSTLIQTSNPWVTEEYNRAREKLFYLALQLHKEFILSSKSCRDNFKNLLMMWKYSENNEHELCEYSQRDKNTSYSHLLNTLFLLTPVMSTTFASVGRFLGNIKEPARIGLLIVDEAGQAAPHVALGALWRCKKAIVVGDPRQVEPVVTDDADAIKHAFKDDVVTPYLNKTLSVQEFADKINPYGAFIKDSINEKAAPTWVGCPLIVHRRCINPMFDISNQLSYDKTMKILTVKAKEEDEAKFVLQKSCWVNVSGKESGKKNHFIHEQGQRALDIIISSFKKYNGSPDLYVISPFTSVISGMKEMINRSPELLKYKDEVGEWADNCCGTVHKFQGKEAKEVIFILGCDEKAIGAVKWVKPNIVNVAATRAKYRLYIIGDYNVWKISNIFIKTKVIIDNY